ncbi:MAG: hypothetical protein VYC40_04425, partial [Pseudomonadota bacterium]|nr:hypothetical protein [Pseudomonadota bacterium]
MKFIEYLRDLKHDDIPSLALEDIISLSDSVNRINGVFAGNSIDIPKRDQEFIQEMAKKLVAIRLNKRNETLRHNTQPMCKPIKSSEELERCLGKILKDSDQVRDQEASNTMKNRILKLSTWHSDAGSDLCDTITHGQCRELYMLLYNYIFNFSEAGNFGVPAKKDLSKIQFKNKIDDFLNVFGQMKALLQNLDPKCVIFAFPDSADKVTAEQALVVISKPHDKLIHFKKTTVAKKTKIKKPQNLAIVVPSPSASGSVSSLSNTGNAGHNFFASVSSQTADVATVTPTLEVSNTISYYIPPVSNSTKDRAELDRHLDTILEESVHVRDQEESKRIKNKILKLINGHNEAGNDLRETITCDQCRKLYMLLYNYIFNFSEVNNFGVPAKSGLSKKQFENKIDDFLKVFNRMRSLLQNLDPAYIIFESQDKAVRVNAEQALAVVNERHANLVCSNEAKKTSINNLLSPTIIEPSPTASGSTASSSHVGLSSPSFFASVSSTTE